MMPYETHAQMHILGRKWGADAHPRKEKGHPTAGRGQVYGAITEHRSHVQLEFPASIIIIMPSNI